MPHRPSAARAPEATPPAADWLSCPHCGADRSTAGRGGSETFRYVESTTVFRAVVGATSDQLLVRDFVEIDNTTRLVRGGQLQCRCCLSLFPLPDGVRVRIDG